MQCADARNFRFFVDRYSYYDRSKKPIFIIKPDFDLLNSIATI